MSIDEGVGEGTKPHDEEDKALGFYALALALALAISPYPEFLGRRLYDGACSHARCTPIGAGQSSLAFMSRYAAPKRCSAL